MSVKTSDRWALFFCAALSVAALSLPLTNQAPAQADAEGEVEEGAIQPDIAQPPPDEPAAEAAPDDAAPAEAAPDEQAAPERDRPVGRLIRIPTPITSTVDSRVRAAVRRIVADTKARAEWPTLIFQIEPGHNDFGKALDLAGFISTIGGATTVAY